MKHLCTTHLLIVTSDDTSILPRFVDIAQHHRSLLTEQSRKY